jgi:predicted Zn-dependent protease
LAAFLTLYPAEDKSDASLLQKSCVSFFPIITFQTTLLMPKKLIALLSIALLALACKTVPITGRSQVRLLPESTMNSMSFTQYDQFLNENKVVTNTAQAQTVKRVGDRIRRAAEVYFAANNMSEALNDFRWEFNLVEDPTVNAWCMPGGKVVIYTGIMPIAQGENGLAVIMGHEVAHALAHHGNERMSQQMAVQMGGMALSEALSSKPQQTQSLFMTAYGIGSQVGALLPFSRTHESEADKIGLYLMAVAGYDVDEAPRFWERMQAGAGGQAPPEFLSTHPSPTTRQTNLKKWANDARQFATEYSID